MAFTDPSTHQPTSIAARLGVGLDEDVRPRLWAKLGLACFFSAYRVWLCRGGELSEHVAVALAALPTARQVGGYGAGQP